MSKPPPSPPPIDELRQEFVAYLDREVDPATMRRIEECMLSNPEVQGEIRQLERVWDMLDELPRTEADDMFTQTTVEMVALEAAADLETQRLATPRRRRRRLMLAAATFFIGGLAGALSAGWIWPDPNEPLLRDLPVLNYLDQYQQAQSIEFLQRLQHEGLFESKGADDQ
jgi:ferric-dicitrate binding protein FerR (iron transport regulator)